MTVIAPQHIGLGLHPPTYYAVSSPEYIAIKKGVLLHLFNDSAVNDTITISHDASYYCRVLPASEELILGPFDLTLFGPTVVLVHSSIAEVTMAALYADYIYPIKAAELTRVNGVLSTTPTILAGVSPSASVEIGG